MQKLQRYCLKDGSQMHLASGAVYDGIAECPTCGRRERLDCGGSVSISAKVSASMADLLDATARAEGLPSRNAVIKAALMAYLDDPRTPADKLDDALGADVSEQQQHTAGFNACANGKPFDEAQAPAWQAGWLDAHDMGEYAPIAAFHLNSEA